MVGNNLASHGTRPRCRHARLLQDRPHNPRVGQHAAEQLDDRVAEELLEEVRGVGLEAARAEEKQQRKRITKVEGMRTTDGARAGAIPTRTHPLTPSWTTLTRCRETRRGSTSSVAQPAVFSAACEAERTGRLQPLPHF